MAGYMQAYIEQIKRNLRDQYGAQVLGGTEQDPQLEIPDGEYPMMIDNKVDHVEIRKQRIFCHRFNEIPPREEGVSPTQ